MGLMTHELTDFLRINTWQRELFPWQENYFSNVSDALILMSGGVSLIITVTLCR